VGRWDALSNAMRTSRNRRIGSREAEQLLTLGLCRSWQVQQKNPKNKPMKAEALRTLAAAAGGAERIAAFCLPLLADGQGSAAPSDAASAAATPSHPGTGKGHVRTTPTPKPHKNG
jgi:hypothetical protein